MRNRILTTGLVAAIAAAAYGCGGTEPTGGTGSGGASTAASASSGATGGGSATSSAASSSATGASAGAGGAPVVTCTPSDGVVLALDSLDFGDVGTDTSASQKIGFDVDGKVSTEASTDLCQPTTGGSKTTTYPDGAMGIDNSFGKNILPQLLGLSPNFSANTTKSIVDGEFTMMLDFVGLKATPDQPALVTRLYGGTPLDIPPTFDGSDCWPVAPELLSSKTDIKSSTVVFDKSSVLGDTWVSGTTGQVTLTIPVNKATISLTIHKAQVTLKFAADHQSATGGLIGGVLDTDEFVKEVKKALYAVNPLYCAAVAETEAKIRQSADIMNDGSQDPAKTCNGISIGLAFTMKGVKLGGVGAPTTPTTKACMP